MSEVQTRTAASRGRGSGRGGRGGFASRGGRTQGRTNGDKFDHKDTDDATAFEDQGELGELKKQYGSKTPLIKELFPDWSEQDILYALQETDGDENLAVTRIAEGTYAPPPLTIMRTHHPPCPVRLSSSALPNCPRAYPPFHLAEPAFASGLSLLIFLDSRHHLPMG